MIFPVNPCPANAAATCSPKLLFIVHDEFAVINIETINEEIRVDERYFEHHWRTCKSDMRGKKFVLEAEFSDFSRGRTAIKAEFNFDYPISFLFDFISTGKLQ